MKLGDIIRRLFQKGRKEQPEIDDEAEIEKEIRLVSANSTPKRSTLLPSGFMIETEENWVEQDELERIVETNGTTYKAIVNDFRTILPINGYPIVNPFDYQHLPSNHHGIGLFGFVAYTVENRSKKIMKMAILPSARIAHIHYPYAEKPLFIDIGNDQYDNLLSQIGLDIIPKGCYPHNLFRDMKDEIRKVAEKYLK